MALKYNIINRRKKLNDLLFLTIHRQLKTNILINANELYIKLIYNLNLAF